MPKQYEAIRDRFIAGGMGEAEAKTRAARIYNAKHPGRPVTRDYENKKRRRRGLRKALRMLIEKAGDKPGHPFRGNQYVAGTGHAKGGYKLHYGASPTLSGNETTKPGPGPKPYERPEMELNAEQQKWHRLGAKFTATANRLLQDVEGEEERGPYDRAAAAHHEAMIFNRTAARIMPKGSQQAYRHRWAVAFHADWKRMLSDMAEEVAAGKKPKQLRLDELKAMEWPGPAVGGTRWPKKKAS